MNEDTLREAIDHWLHTATPAVRRFTPHDLRCTVKSHLCALGVPRDISEECLNNKLSGWRGSTTGTRPSRRGGRVWGRGRACYSPWKVLHPKHKVVESAPSEAQG